MYDYIIIGGGIAGLYCGLYLPNSLVLESNHYLGGRIFTHKNPQYEIGAGRYNINHKILISLINEFNLTPIKLDTRVDYIYKSQINIKNKTKIPPFVIENVNKIFHEKIRSLYKTKLPPDLRDITMEEYCIQKFGKKGAEDLCSIFGYYSEFKSLNAYDSIRQFQNAGNTHFILKEGMGELIRRMSKQVNYKLNHKVKHIEQIGNYYKVDEYTTKHIIFAIPPSNMSAFPILNPIRPLLETVTSNPLLRVYAIYKNRWFEGLPVITTNSFIRHIIPINSKTGLIMISYVEGKDAEPYLNKTGKIKDVHVIQNKIQTELKLLFPYREITEPSFLMPYYWDIGDHAWLPGYNSDKIGKQLLNPMKNIYICGEAFSHTQCWVEGAVQTASNVLDIIDA
jgi:monoamine oxidase